jgi:hypothetical protein
MGYVRVDAALKNPFTGRSVSVKAPVDTGVTLTVISRKVADELGLPVIGRAPWRLWVGRHIHILVSDDVDAVLIGVVTPEIPGLRLTQLRENRGRLRHTCSRLERPW